MVFARTAKIGIKRTLTTFFFIAVSILAAVSVLTNAVFAAVDLRIPVEINWNDSNASTRPAQVILHVRRVGSNENLKTVTLTSSNVDPNNPDRWVTTISGLNYNPSYAYEVYQDSVANYTITQSASVSVATQLGVVSYNHQTVSGRIRNREYQNTNFILASRGGGSPDLWTVEPYNLATLNTIIEDAIGSGHTVAAGNYYDGVSASSSEFDFSYDSYDESSTLNSMHGGSFDIYYGEIGTIAQASRASFTNTDNTVQYHNVAYQFTGSVQPPTASSLLPAVATYAVGDTVTVAQDPTATGYRFLGWQINGSPAGTSFTMPSSDVTITGSWEYFNGYFAPSISKQVSNPQNIYRFGDTVQFQVTVTNTASFPITNVEVTESLTGAVFTAGSGYTISNTGGTATIASIPANGSATLTAEYLITDDVTLTGRTNIVEITAASASNYYYLDPNQSYVASATFDTQSWQDVPVLTGVNISQGTTLLYVFLLAVGASGLAGGVVVKCRKEGDGE